MKAHWNLQHGMSSTRIYKLWSEMKARCEKPDHQAWADYGGRGITVCTRWSDSFQSFYADFGRLRGDGESIDRVDNDKGYEPGNVRWSTRTEQARNKRNNARHLAFGELKTCQEWAEDPRCKAPAETIKCRIKRGWTIEDAVTLPPIGRGNRLFLVSGENKALRRVLQGEPA